MEMVSNPLIRTEKPLLEKSISVQPIIRGYQKYYGVDVAPYFSSLSTISLFTDPHTGYQFYHPLHLGGDGEFYAKMQGFEWYYMPWKWEHELSATLIKEGQRVLEVGAGKGDFLKKLQVIKDVDAIGLELNDEAIANADETVDLQASTIEEFSQNPAQVGAYDVVCSFQVLEHISQVESFISGKITCLKPGGKLIIGVPNNASFFEDDPAYLLNMPPHHMGLWNENSLRNLQEIFPIRFERVYHEPLQKHHFDWYMRLAIRKISGGFGVKVLNKMLKWGLRPMLHNYLARRADNIHGHSILAVYEKI